MRRARAVPVLGLASLAAFLAIACDEPGEASGLTGPVVIDGSSTVFPATEAVAEEFMLLNPNARVTVGVSGTGGGFQRFCTGDTDISNASRPMSDAEAQACEANGIDTLQLTVGLDGLAIVTNPGNEFLDTITLEELETIWEPAAERTIRRWSQVNPEWPDMEIELYGPGVDSGTFDFFTEEVMGESGASRADYTASENDNTLIVGVAGTDGALGFFGFAYYEENQERLQIVPVDDGDGPVTPSDETVADGSYPLARPLYLYVNVDSLNTKPQVREFVRYYLSDEGMTLVELVGYTALPSDTLTDTREALEAAITSEQGARVGG